MGGGGGVGELGRCSQAKLLPRAPWGPQAREKVLGAVEGPVESSSTLQRPAGWCKTGNQGRRRAAPSSERGGPLEARGGGATRSTLARRALVELRARFAGLPAGTLPVACCCGSATSPARSPPPGGAPHAPQSHEERGRNVRRSQSGESTGTVRALQSELDTTCVCGDRAFAPSRQRP